jgi:hypothetical protein
VGLFGLGLEKLEIAKGLGETIIKALHNSFVSQRSEDLHHITSLKQIIMAIAEYLNSEGLNAEGVNGITEHLNGLGKSLFLESCLSSKDATEDEETVRGDSALWFDHI